jgi:hypothetical protein
MRLCKFTFSPRTAAPIAVTIGFVYDDIVREKADNASALALIVAMIAPADGP